VAVWPRAEDIHYATEKSLFRLLGPLAGKCHTARSRNDQVVTAFRLYLRDHLDRINRRLARLMDMFVDQAEKNITGIMPGFTHLQPGQPILVAHHLLAYAWMLSRDRERFRDVSERTNISPLGAAAMAGTSFPIDRQWVARELGFSGVTENSMDAVSDRDFLVEFLSSASLVMVHLSRFCEELILWSNPVSADPGPISRCRIQWPGRSNPPGRTPGPDPTCGPRSCVEVDVLFDRP